jgi:hypothetical protein
MQLDETVIILIYTVYYLILIRQTKNFNNIFKLEDHSLTNIVTRTVIHI